MVRGIGSRRGLETFSWSPIGSASLGSGNLCMGSHRDLFEVMSSARRGEASAAIDGVVVTQLLLPAARHRPKNANVRIGHERVRPGSGTGSATETATGSESAASSGTNRRNPTMSSRRWLCCGDSPHLGHARRYATAPVNRSLQLGQHAWIMIGSPDSQRRSFREGRAHTPDKPGSSPGRQVPRCSVRSRPGGAPHLTRVEHVRTRTGTRI